MSKPAIWQIFLATILAAPQASALPATAGHSTLAGLSGNRSDHSTGEIELPRGKGVIKIFIDEIDNVPCAISIEGKRVGQNADFETEEADRCPRSGTAGHSASARYGYYVTAVKVCTSSRRPQTIQGIEISTTQIGRRGIRSNTASDRSYSSDCDHWQSWSRCPSGSVVTGFVAHFEDIKGGPDALTGLQAVCRQVTIE